LYEFEFGSAGQAVAGGDHPDGTVVQSESVAAVWQLVGVGHVPLGVEDGCQAGHAVAQGLAGELFAALFDSVTAATLEQTRDKLGVFVCEVAEQFDGEVTGGGPGEKGFAQFGAVVEVSRPAGSAPLLAGRHEAAGPESG
jgi:hypothetical protein